MNLKYILGHLTKFGANLVNENLSTVSNNRSALQKQYICHHCSDCYHLKSSVQTLSVYYMQKCLNIWSSCTVKYIRFFWCWCILYVIGKCLHPGCSRRWSETYGSVAVPFHWLARSWCSRCRLWISCVGLHTEVSICQSRRGWSRYCSL